MNTIKYNATKSDKGVTKVCFVNFAYFLFTTDQNYCKTDRFIFSHRVLR